MNVKPGDLAIVQGTTADWNGRTCTVLRASPVFLQVHLAPTWGHMWEVEMARPCQWLNGKVRITGHIPDAHLRRLSGPDVDITETTDLEVTA